MSSKKQVFEFNSRDAKKIYTVKVIDPEGKTLMHESFYFRASAILSLENLTEWWQWFDVTITLEVDDTRSIEWFGAFGLEGE